LLPRRAKRLAEELRRVLGLTLAAQIEQLSEGDDFAAQVAALIAGDTDPYSAADALLA